MLVNLPLVLPPVVVGFYLLLLFNPSAPLGHFLQHVFHLRLVFTFEGLVVGSALFNVPFMVNPVLSGLESLPRSLCEASFVLGKGRWTTFWRVLLPSIRPSILTGLILTFAHTIGEFGMVLMIGGKIPGGRALRQLPSTTKSNRSISPRRPIFGGTGGRLVRRAVPAHSCQQAIRKDLVTWPRFP